MSAISISPITTSSSFHFSRSGKNHEKPIKFSAQIFDSCRHSIRREPISWIRMRKARNFVKGFTEVCASRSDEDVDVFEQEAFVIGSSKFGAGGLEATLNTMSKWIIATLLAAVIVWRHDAKVLWAATGALVNNFLSIELKKIVNQERPDSTSRSDPGMPSNHAQSIFYIILFLNFSMTEWYGMNALTTALSGFSIIIGTYFSWLRVSQKFHTLVQVVVGAVIGSIFSVFWFWSWDALVFNLFTSSLWARIVVLMGAAGYCVGFLFHVVRFLVLVVRWIGDER